MNSRIFSAIGSTFTALATLAFSQSISLPAHAALQADAQPTDPECQVGHSKTLHVAMELQDGVFAWRSVGAWDICVNDGDANGQSKFIVNFTGEAYQSIITISGRQVDLPNAATSSWAFYFSRQDIASGQTSAAGEASVLLQNGKSLRFVLKGNNLGQSRNLRLTIR